MHPEILKPAGTAHGLVITTVASEAEAEALARQIVAAGLGACVQLEPVRSVYRWQGQVCVEPEWRLQIKTSQSRYAELEAFILERHSYELPEIVMLPIAAGLAGYLAWVDSGTTPDDGKVPGD